MAQDFVRMAPSVPRLRGSVWRATPNEHKEWEVEFSFKAHGQSPVGGRGFAFWYTQDRAVDGPVFGNQDKWKGVGVFMDTSDPANQVRAAHDVRRNLKICAGKKNVFKLSKHNKRLLIRIP